MYEADSGIPSPNLSAHGGEGIKPSPEFARSSYIHCPLILAHTTAETGTVLITENSLDKLRGRGKNLKNNRRDSYESLLFTVSRRYSVF
jgi:hypothetical protein